MSAFPSFSKLSGIWIGRVKFTGTFCEGSFLSAKQSSTAFMSFAAAIPVGVEGLSFVASRLRAPLHAA